MTEEEEGLLRKSSAAKAVNEVYLGDGLYASFDGFSIWLRAPRMGGDHYVALDPLVLKEFIEYAAKVGVLKLKI